MQAYFDRGYVRILQGNLSAARDDLSEGIRLAPGIASAELQVQALRDRAYVFKLMRDWHSSAQDLTAALNLEVQTPGQFQSLTAIRAQTLMDRAFVYLQRRDPWSARLDYEQAYGLLGSRDALARRAYLLSIMPPPNARDRTTLYVFVPPGAQPATYTDRLRRVEAAYTPGSFFIQRWFLSELPKVAEVRYFSPRDEEQATLFTGALRLLGFELTQSVLYTDGRAQRSGQFELWLAAAAPPRYPVAQ
jgi:hypothetical protein